jgi:hypothetical protein
VEAVAVEPVVRFTRHAWTDYQHGRLGRVIAALPNSIRSAQALEETSPADDPRPWMASGGFIIWPRRHWPKSVKRTSPGLPLSGQ